MLEEGEDLAHEAPVRELVIASDADHRDVVLRSYRLDHVLVRIEGDQGAGSFWSHRVQ